MNPIIARLYPSLNRDLLYKKPIKPNVNSIMNMKKEQQQDVKIEEPKPEQKSEPKQEVKPEPKKRTIDDELDEYIGKLEEEYNKIPPKPRTPTPPIDSKKYIPKTLRHKETIEEKKSRIVTALARKKINKAEQELNKLSDVYKQYNGDEKAMIEKEKELKRGIRLIRNSRILGKTGDITIENNNEENNNIL